MSSSYNRNIERMRSRERLNAQDAINQSREQANVMGRRDIEDAQNVSRQLGAFSQTLAKMAEEKKARHHARGAAVSSRASCN
tara:strand:- start:107 stop:352 length:246 start_codon:yes stop_codon:yes gene_type:complete